jgi:hypothetical protein
LSTVLPAVVTATAGIAAVAVIGAGSANLQLANWTDRSPIGHLYKFYEVPGGMRAIGWNFDPDAKTSALRTIARVDHRWAAGTTANVARQNVAAAHPHAGANHGFSFSVPVPEGRHLVCIQVRNVKAGRDFTLGCVTRTFDYGPVGAVGVVQAKPGAIHVNGWTFDRDKFTTALTTTITVDGVAHTIVANGARPLVPAAFPNAGTNHGFDATYPVAQGTHRICVKVRNIGFGSDNSFGCRTLTLNESPRGSLDSAKSSAGKLRVTGWAYDPDNPTSALTVRIKVDSTTYSVTANRARTDVATKYVAAGKYHGFDESYALPEGSHSVCVTAINVSYGSNVAFPCRTVALTFTPTAVLSGLTAKPTGALVTGWASDPDTASPISVAISSDGHAVATVTANAKGATHSGHVFARNLTLRSGKHTVCAVGQNVLYGTRNSAPACRAVTLALKPLGKFESLTRATGSSNLHVAGWALDPDTTSSISVAATLDGVAQPALLADATRTDLGQTYSAFGTKHGISATLAADAGEHIVCLTAKNVGGGADLNLGCKLIIAVHPTAPDAPRSVTAQAGYGGATITWARPTSDGGAPWTNYTVKASPGGASVRVGASNTTATLIGLKPSTTYSFTVTATNVAGTSAAGTSPNVKTQASPPAQTHPAPVSTSRYPRNIRAATATDLATMRAEGKADAVANPSGHGYLILLDIGGQDQFDGGVVLSATTRFVSYANLVSDLKAYVDGYHSGQRVSAPITVAIGTNNDMDVTSTAGKAWATRVVNPVRSYATRYPGMTIAGANDIEPGFRASYSATKNWLTGYLAATSAPFVFNGSADGCAWTVISRGCNNGWTMSGLYNLAAGAAPIRMLNLPQVYNTTMAAQWKYISLTGIAQKKPRINFAGPLTEWTACDQTNSCGSLTGRTAWSTMWSNLQSDARLKVSSLPYSTDLRIDR